MKHGDQKKLSDVTGISRSLISAILKGKRRPSWDKAKRLARVTSTEPQLWMEGDARAIKEAVRLTE